MKALMAHKVVQEHSFLEFKVGDDAKFWDDLWNQLPKIGINPCWQHIRAKGIEEGKIKVCNYWEEGTQWDHR